MKKTLLFGIALGIVLIPSMALSIPINTDPCITWECTETVEKGERERTETREVTTYRREESQETRYVWHENEGEDRHESRRENRRSNVDRFWFANGGCRISHVKNDHLGDHIKWSNNPLVTVTSNGGVYTYDIQDVDECGRIRDYTDRNRRISNNNSSSNTSTNAWTNGWWEALTISSWIEIPETTYFTDNWMENYEYIKIVCIPTYNCPVPEPATMFLFGSGLVCLGTMARKRKIK